MKKSKKKLGIEKFRVAKLTNAFIVIGGSEGDTNGDSGGNQTDRPTSDSTVQCLTVDPTQ